MAVGGGGAAARARAGSSAAATVEDGDAHDNSLQHMAVNAGWSRVVPDLVGGTAPESLPEGEWTRAADPLLLDDPALSVEALMAANPSTVIVHRSTDGLGTLRGIEPPLAVEGVASVLEWRAGDQLQTDHVEWQTNNLLQTDHLRQAEESLPSTEPPPSTEPTPSTEPPSFTEAPQSIEPPPLADMPPSTDRPPLADTPLPTDAPLPTDTPPSTDAAPSTDTLPSTDTPPSAQPPPSTEAQPGAGAAPAADEIVCICTDFFRETDDPDVDKDRWMTVRTFISAMLAEPVLNVFGGCDAIDVEVLARALINAVPSAVWIQLAPAVTPVVFVWQFLLLLRDAMDASPSLCQAVGELIFFCVTAEEETMPRWEAKAGRAAKDYRKQWQDGDATVYKEWLQTLGIEPAVSHVVAGDASKPRVVEQANEERTGQAWPGREVLRAFPEDSTAERQRAKAADKRKDDKPKTKEAKKAWDADDCRHDYPVSVLRAPGVITFMCGCGYSIGFELLRETESPAHAVAALVQRFKTLPRVIYFDTACQAQRNALRRVPWLMDGCCTAWFIDRFHRCNHKCSPVFNADQFPQLTRGHDTSGAERQHSIKKRSKNSLSYMTQRRFIVRSRFIAAHNNIRVSQRRQATAMAAATRVKGEPKTAVEIQHKPVEAYYHHFVVSHCELGDACPCRQEVKRTGPAGLERKA